LSEKHIHIISFDVPSPPDYGGIIDVYNRIKLFHSNNVKIHLHCFQYGRSSAAELEKMCYSVNYYKRKSGLIHFFSRLPYIVSTRRSDGLLANLLKDNYPILFEGIHTCYLLSHPLLKDRVKLVRSHNVEHHYYQGLAEAEANIFKKIFFITEAKKLERFELLYRHATHILSVSHKDHVYFKQQYTNQNITYLSTFQSYSTVEIKEGRGEYALYHGNLSVSENNKAALFLVEQVFNKLPYSLIIAGNKPSSALIKAASKVPNIKIQTKVSAEQMNKLVADAHINVLPTFQATGIKLKLLAALFIGRHCLVNSRMVAGTGLDGLCVKADTAAEMKRAITNLWAKSFNSSETVKREAYLYAHFDKAKNIKTFINLVWPTS
jgi:Glycosyl transferases group 1